MEIVKDTGMYKVVRRNRLKTVRQILEEHGVTHQTLPNGRLEAFNVCYDNRSGEDRSHWVDVHDWSREKIFQWLGY